MPTRASPKLFKKSGCIFIESIVTVCKLTLFKIKVTIAFNNFVVKTEILAVVSVLSDAFVFDFLFSPS